MSSPPISADVLSRAARVRLACFDVDGVLTDGRLVFDHAGNESKAFHAHDGMGLQLLRDAGIEVAFITARTSPVVARRGQELGLTHVYQGVKDKLARLTALVGELGIDLQAVAYTGDDLADLGCLSRAGLAIAPANAQACAIERAHWRTQRAGGDGAVREVCDLIVAAQGHTAALLARYLPA